MNVIVTIEYERSWEGKAVTVRKCPPNYKETFGKRHEDKEEYICELDDYTDEDIKNYFSKEDLTAWKEEHG